MYKRFFMSGSKYYAVSMRLSSFFYTFNVVDIAFQKKPEARRFAKLITY